MIRFFKNLYRSLCNGSYRGPLCSFDGIWR